MNEVEVSRVGRLRDGYHPRILHEQTNERLAIRGFVVLFVDGFLSCGRDGAGNGTYGKRRRQSPSLSGIGHKDGRH